MPITSPPAFYEKLKEENSLLPSPLVVKDVNAPKISLSPVELAEIFEYTKRMGVEEQLVENATKNYAAEEAAKAACQLSGVPASQEAVALLMNAAKGIGTAAGELNQSVKQDIVPDAEEAKEALEKAKTEENKKQTQLRPTPPGGTSPGSSS